MPWCFRSSQQNSQPVSVFDDVWWPILMYGNTRELHVSVTSILQIKQNKNLSKNCILSTLQSSKIMTTYRCRWVFKKRGEIGKCRHLEAFAKKEVHFSVCLKYLLKPRCTTPWMPRGRIGINRQRKQKAYPCFEKIIYIFCGSFYYCDSFAYGVRVMWKISSTHYYALNPLSSFVYISLFCTIS